MAVEITLIRVKQKLHDLLNDRQIVDLRTQIQVIELITSLTSIDLKNKHHLEAVYLAEDTIDIFMFSRTNLLKQKSLPWFDLKSESNQVHFSDKIKKLASDLKKVQSSDGSRNTEASPDGSRNIKASPDGPRNIIDDSGEEGKSESKKFVARVLKSGKSLVRIPVVDVSARPGKETMLRKIYNDLVRGKHFDCHGWVQISENFEKRKFVVDIMQQVSINNKFSEIEEDGIKYLPFHSLKQKLRNLLISMRYLVVVFNVRTPDIWEILKCFFPNSLNGSRVILSFCEDEAGRYPDMEVTYFVCEDANDGDVPDTPLQVPNTELEFEGLRRIFSDKEGDIVGMKNEKVRLAGLVLSQRELHCLIVVVGMAGSGKTTLVKTIYDHSHTRKNFGCFAWVNVYVSNVFDKRNVLIDMLKQVKELWVDEELPLEELEYELKEFLSQKKFLIVLDDVHAASAWNKLRRAFPLNSDSRVILITRYTNVARRIDPSSVVVQLHPLNDTESWTLFSKTLGKDGNDEKLIEFKEKILKKCRGLPLAITVLGGFLSTKDYSDSIWSKVTEDMKQGEKEKEKKHGEQEENNATQSATVDEDPSAPLDQSVFSDKLDPSRILDLSYQELSYHSRACLHYFCLFPKSYEIPIRRLFLLWLAEELAQTPAAAGENKTIEDQIENNFNELEKRNMIEVAKRRSNGSAKTCRLPSILYDKIFEDAQDMGSFHIYGKSGYKASSSSEFNIYRLAEHSSIQINTPLTDSIHNLRSYISFDTQKRDNPSGEIGNLLDKTINRRGFGLLRVLDLEKVYKPGLPEKIGRLLLLRYVGLRWTFLDSIPDSVGDLPCLETLDVKHTNLTTLPISIWNAKKLRHLYMNEIHLPMSSQKQFPSNFAADLQTLWGLLIGSNNPPIEWLTGLKGLRKLGLTCHKASLGKINDWIFRLRSLQSLRLRSINDVFEPSDLHLASMYKQEKLTDLYLVGKLTRALDITELPQNLRILTLSVSHLTTDPMPILGKLQHLNILRLLAHSYIDEQMTCKDDGFPRLRVLKLWMLKELKEWTVEEGAMPELRELGIRNCARLKKANGLEKLTNLKKVTLTNMQQDFVTEVDQRLNKDIIREIMWDIKPSSCD